MKVFAELDDQCHPPRLQLFVHHAPHRRMKPIEIFYDYRKAIMEAMTSVGIKTPIDYEIDLVAAFINPSSPDYDNLLMALYRALDGKALKGPAPLKTDGLIDTVKLYRLYTGGNKKPTD